MKKIMKALLNDERGTSAVEMGLICSLIILAMLGALQGFADGSTQIWNRVSSESANAMSGAGS
jgi:pilus assembly protein Flp/PilA